MFGLQIMPLIPDKPRHMGRVEVFSGELLRRVTVNC